MLHTAGAPRSPHPSSDTNAIVFLHRLVADLEAVEEAREYADTPTPSTVGVPLATRQAPSVSVLLRPMHDLCTTHRLLTTDSLFLFLCTDANYVQRQLTQRLASAERQSNSGGYSTNHQRTAAAHRFVHTVRNSLASHLLRRPSAFGTDPRVETEVTDTEEVGATLNVERSTSTSRSGEQPTQEKQNKEEEESEQSRAVAGAVYAWWPHTCTLSELLHSTTPSLTDRVAANPYTLFSTGCRALDLLLCGRDSTLSSSSPSWSRSPVKGRRAVHGSSDTLCYDELTRTLREGGGVGGSGESEEEEEEDAVNALRGSGGSADGGFRSGWVTEIYGEAGSGKTQLVLQCLLQHIATSIAAEEFGELLLLPASPTTANTSSSSSSPRSGAVLSSLPALLPPTSEVARLFAREREQAVGCLFLVSEDVPSARLGPLARGAVERVLRRCGDRLARLPEDAYRTVVAHLRGEVTVRVVLSRLQIKPIASLSDLDALLSSGQLMTVLRALRRVSSPPVRRAAGVSENGGHKHRGYCGGVVVVDSIAAAAMKSEESSSFLSEKRQRAYDGHGGGATSVEAADRVREQLQLVGQQLRQLAVEEDVCVLVTNQVRSVPSELRWRAPVKRARLNGVLTSSTDERARRPPRGRGRDGEGEMVPALGLTWASTPHVRVFLRKGSTARYLHDDAGRGNGRELRQMVLLSSPSAAPGQEAFYITERGIEDATL